MNADSKQEEYKFRSASIRVHPRPNLLELKPKRNVEWKDEEGRVVLMVPRFYHPLLRKWLLPLLPKPDFRVKLDTFGSFLWRRCDGKTDVATMADAMRAEFGAQVEPVYERIGAFIRKLEREEMVKTNDEGREPMAEGR